MADLLPRQGTSHIQHRDCPPDDPFGCICDRCELVRLQDVIARASRMAEQERAGMTQQILQEGL